MANFLGLRTSTDFTVEGQRPKNWREAMLRIYPNGKMPLTALTALMKTEKVDDPEFNWFVKVFVDQSVPSQGIYTTSALGTAFAAAVTPTTEAFIKMTAADITVFKTGHVVLLRGTTPETDVRALVKNVVPAAASSYIHIVFLETRATPTVSAANVKTVYIIGSAYAEGALIGDAISTEPVKFRNFTQIFRNSLEITRTAERTKLRTPQAYQEAKRDALEFHGIEMEKAFMYGIPTEQMIDNAPCRTTGGLLWAIQTGGGFQGHMPTVLGSGATWVDDGYLKLMEVLEQIFRYGDSEKLCYAGTGAVLAFNKLAYLKGDFKITTQTTDFGLKVNEIVTPFGTLMLKVHPLFSHEVTNNRSMVIFEPRNLKYRVIDDTRFYEDDGKHGHERRDGKKEEFLTECGLEFGSAKGWGYITGVGLDGA